MAGDAALTFLAAAMHHLSSRYLGTRLEGLMTKYWISIRQVQGDNFTNKPEVGATRYLRVPDALEKSLWISIFTAAGVALYALARVHDYYLAAMFGYLAYTSFQTLQALTGRGGGYGGW